MIHSLTKKPVVGAVVELKNSSFGVGYYQAKTDKQGKFAIKDFIDEVHYKFHIQAKGFVSYQTSGYVKDLAAKTELDPEGILSGVVASTDEKPLAGVVVRVRARDYSVRQKPQIFTTGPDGKFYFDKLPRSGYNVTFTKDGYLQETAAIKEIASGQIFSLPMVLYRPAKIAGKIFIGGFDKPIPAKNIYVNLTRGKIHHTSYSYHNGTFLLEGIKPGTFTLKLSHAGFKTIPSRKITFKEGESKTNFHFTLEPRDAEVSLTARRYVFPPGRKVSFSMRSLRLEKVKVRIYRASVAELIGPSASTQNTAKVEKPFREWEEPVKYFQPYEWRYNALEVKEALPTGGYRMEVSGAGGALAKKYFTVTTTGIVVKRSQKSIFAYATDLITNKPLANAKVIVFAMAPKKKSYQDYEKLSFAEFLTSGAKVLLQGKTNEYGVFHLPLAAKQNVYIYAIADKANFAVCASGAPYSFDDEVKKYLIYTDRPTYRAGHTVFFKVLGKERKEKFLPLAQKKLSYKVNDSVEGKTIVEGKVTLDDWGTAHGKFTLPKKLSLGRYKIELESSSDSGTFYVEQYRKPEFKINITPTRKFFTNGDRISFKVDAKYFFGSPLKNALVSYRFYESKLDDRSNTYWWEDGYERNTSYRRVKLEGEKYLDANGLATLTLEAGSYPYDREITLEVSVVDKSNVSLTAAKKVTVGRGEFYIKIIPEYNFFASRDKKSFTVKALDFAGEPVATKLDIKFFRYIWKPWQRVYVHDAKPLHELQVQTGEDGTAKLVLEKELQTPGEIDIIATGVDKRQNEITGSYVFWLYDTSKTKVQSKFKNLQLSLRENHLQEEGDVTVLIKSRYTGVPVCLTLEGKDIYDKKVIFLENNVMAVRFPIKKSYAPNLFVTATMQKNRALFISTQELSIPYKDTKVKLAVVPGQKKYGPGEQVELEIQASDETGQPLQTDVSLAVVDEALFQIREDLTPRMNPYFYTRISNWVSTNYSFPISLLAGAGKSGKDKKIRKNFKDTAYWNPAIRTDKDGKATVAFVLPDNLTTWRMTSRAHDKQGRVGESKSEILVSKDLIARIGRPRFFTEKDEIALLGIVTNNSKQGLSRMQSTFQMDGKTLQPEKSRMVSLPPAGSVRSYYQSKVPFGKTEAKLSYSVASTTHGEDALEYTLPVHKRGVSLTRLYTGDLKHSRLTSIPIESNRDVEMQPEELEITVHTGVLSKLLSSLEYLSTYPYGCTEQTISKFLPALYLDEIWKKSKKTKQSIDPNLDKNILVGIGRITELQNYDGTWGYWYGDSGNESLTAYALLALYQAREKGYTVEETVITNGIKAAKRILQNAKATDSFAAFLTYVLTLYEGGIPKYLYTLDKNVDSLDAYQLAYLVKAVATLQKQWVSDKASGIDASQESPLYKKVKNLPKYLKRLQSLAKRDSKGVYFTDGYEYTWQWTGGRTEISAIVLSALQQAGDTSSLSTEILHSLYRRSRGNFWNSTRETAHVLLGIADYLQNNPVEPNPSGKITFVVDGKPQAKFSYDKNTNVPLQKLVSLRDNKQGKTLEIQLQGSEQADVSFTYRFSGTLYLKKQKIPQSYRNGLRVEREFFRVKRVLDIENQEYLVPQKMRAGETLKVGEEVMVRLHVRAEKSLENVALESFLPSGFEVSRQNAYGEGSGAAYSRKEKWDDRMLFFFTEMAKDSKYEISYLMRAELPGNFYVKPAKAECMYEPSLRAWSEQQQIRVTK
ncbi:MAG: carboxypeptidase regulatory-like domain-containing protein [Spirochaetota bacterium]